MLIMIVCFSWAISTIQVNNIDRKINKAAPCAGLTTAECAYKLLKALPANQRRELGITEHRIQRLHRQARKERRALIRKRHQKAVSQSPTHGTTPLPTKRTRPQGRGRPPHHSTSPRPSSPSPPPPPPSKPQPLVQTPPVTVPGTPVTPPVTVPSICVPSC